MSHYIEKMLYVIIISVLEQPDKNIIEGGGLSNIRRKIEEADGYMKIQSIPELIINIGLKTSDMGNA